MKKNLLIAAALCVCAFSSFGQGIIPFAASGSPAPGGGQIKYSTDGTTRIDVPTGNPDAIPGGFGQINLAFYAASNGTVLTMAGAVPNITTNAGWYIQTSALIQQIAPFAGASPTVNNTMNAILGSAGTTLEVELVAWSGTSADFASALASGNPVLLGWSGSVLSGGAFGWSQVTGTTTAPVALVTGVNGFNGISVAPVPEPATIVLGGLGAAALLLFRRRK